MGFLRRDRKKQKSLQAPNQAQRPPRPEPGLVRGRHFTEWVEEVKQLKRDGRQQEVIDLCTEAVEATEAEYRVDGLAVAPWWYEQVALAARRSDQPLVERQIMARYLAHPGPKHPDYVTKFEKALAKLDAKEHGPQP